MKLIARFRIDPHAPPHLKVIGVCYEGFDQFLASWSMNSSPQNTTLGPVTLHNDNDTINCKHAIIGKKIVLVSTQRK